MVTQIQTSDSIIWNVDDVIVDICYCMSLNESLIIDLNQEGPCVTSLNLYNILEKCASTFEYDLSNITIHTANVLEHHDQIKISCTPPTHFVESTISSLKNISIVKERNLKHFGLFIGRSNTPRLSLATFLSDHKDHLVQSFHYDYLNDFHTANIGLEDTIRNYAQENITSEAKFLTTCPIKIDNVPVTYPMLMDQHNNIHTHYSKFFVEIVCETYYSGNTFFPTEKIWRPIMLKTPFIVQGPQWFLQNLKDMGFKTFDKWWDEGYSEDPPEHSVTEIKTVVEFMLNKTNNELLQMYSEMHDVLEHNYNTLVNLNKEDFLKLNNE